MRPHDSRPADVLDQFGAPEQVKQDLERFADLVRLWQGTHNLISAASVPELWTRHIADSYQLVSLAPAFKTWVDLGSGAGFPGIVACVATKGAPDQRFTFVESSGKKAAFLRTAIRTLGLPADVANERIEQQADLMAGQADVISARALAPLPALLRLAYPYAHEKTTLLFLKGREFASEAAEAERAWEYELTVRPSATDPEGSIAALRHLRPKGRA